jgi:hypothetical protein
MNTAVPDQTTPVTVPPLVRASALAAWQLVEDARNRGPERRPQSARFRILAQRAVADRRAERDLRAS